MSAVFPTMGKDPKTNRTMNKLLSWFVNKVKNDKEFVQDYFVRIK
jgi:hypothetical protein